MSIAKDGGYYAIKGFLYQFDKTIIDILDNPTQEILIEKEQDVAFDKYVVQVKHKETQDFSNSKIRKPVIQLLDIHKKDATKKLSLYCYFKDKEPFEWRITEIEELDKILGVEKGNYSVQEKVEFIKDFKIIFSENYEEQFNIVIDKVKNSFKLKEMKQAVYYHSFFRAHLLQVAVLPIEQRKVTKNILESHISSINQHVFFSKYSEMLGRESFLKFIKKEYFIRNNLNGYERLFIVDCDDEVTQTEIIGIINDITSRFQKRHKSPAPYICLRNLSLERINAIKSDLVDMHFSFLDGTFFNGDRFRINRLAEKDTGFLLKCRFVNEENLQDLIQQVAFKEYYHFFLYEYIDIKTEYLQIKIELEKTREIKWLL